MNTSDTALETTIRELGSVTSEIGRLRDSVAQHHTAALGLDSVAATLTDLTSLLKQLPTELRNEFSGVSVLINQLEIALRPAGVLESTIGDLVRSNEGLLSQIHAERELLLTEMKGFRIDVGSVRELVQELNGQLRAEIGEVHAATQQRATSSELLAVHGDVRQMSDQVVLCNDRLVELGKGFDSYRHTQASDTEAIKTRLAKLTGLAKRGFIALIRGKDAPPEAL